MTAISSNRLFVAGLAALLVGLALGPVAQAQEMSTNSASYNAGYGRTAGQENRAVEFGSRDSSNNLTIVNGLIQSSDSQSSFSNMSGGVFSSSSGVGSGGSTAIGNNLVVVTQGNWNTVIVTSVQTNTGNVTATTTNGGD